MNNQLILRRMKRLEGLVEPKTTNATRVLGDSPEFKKFVEAQGLDFEATHRSGDILKALPRELLIRIVEHLKALNNLSSSKHREIGNGQ